MISRFFSCLSSKLRRKTSDASAVGMTQERSGSSCSSDFGRCCSCYSGEESAPTKNVLKVKSIKRMRYLSREGEAGVVRTKDGVPISDIPIYVF